MREMSSETRILIFGQSNTAGAQLASQKDSWPNLLAADLPSATGMPANITQRLFYAHAPGADRYLEQELSRHEPDIVFIMLSSFAFLAPMVGPSVRRRFGNRAGDAYSWLESRFDQKTRHTGEIGRGANRAVRRLTQAVLGAEPITSYETVIEGTQKALQRLARMEHVQTVAVRGFVRLGDQSSPTERARIESLRRFEADTRAICERLHIVHIDMQERPSIDRNVAVLPDGVHITSAAHRAVADAILEAFAEGRLHPV